jgi:hypothetical protein
MDKGKIKEETFRELYGKSYASQKVRTIIIGLQRINNLKSTLSLNLLGL